MRGSRLVVGVWALAVACASPPPPLPTGTLIPARDAGLDAPPPDAPPESDASLEDGDDTFADAREVALGSTTLASIARPGDEDVYRVEVPPGTGWLRVATDANPIESPRGIDTVIWLYDATERALARSDAPYRFIVGLLDSEIVHPVPDAGGTFYVVVLERSGFPTPGPASEGSPDYHYRLIVERAESAPRTLLAAEVGDDPSTAETVVPARTAPLIDRDEIVVLGLQDHEGDVDVYRFTLPPASRVMFRMWPTGRFFTGTRRARAWIEDGDGVIVRTEQPANEDIGRAAQIVPWLLGPGDLTLHVERVRPGPIEPSAFHGGALLVYRDLPADVEAEDPLAPGANDDPAAAEAITLPRGTLVTRLSTDADVDCFHFSLPAGRATVSCRSAIDGSGVLGMTAEVIDPGGAVVGTYAEGDPALAITTTGGRWVIRVRKTGQDPAVRSDVVWCGVVGP